MEQFEYAIDVLNKYTSSLSMHNLHLKISPSSQTKYWTVRHKTRDVQLYSVAAESEIGPKNRMSVLEVRWRYKRSQSTKHLTT